MGYRLDILALLTILLTTGVVLTVPVHEGKINGNWSEWIDISICYAKSCNNSCWVYEKDCDKGHVEQIRFCNNPSPRNGGQWCHGPVLRTADCINYMRPGWGEWGPVTCDTGCRSSENDIVVGSRERTCTNPPPIYETDKCCGQWIQTELEDPDCANTCRYAAVKTSFSTVGVLTGINFSLSASGVFTGAPLPTIRWSRHDGPLPSYAILGDGILIIPDARLEDAGMYTCTAINQAGSVQSKVVLYVRARPLISVPQTSMTAALGDSASFGCEATGYPRPQITWYRKDGQMPSDYTIVDGNLKIPRVKTEDAGTYICSAQNQYGQSNASVDLKIGAECLIEEEKFCFIDLIPHFKQNPKSYIAYRPLSDVYLDFDLLLSLKPESTEGMVLYMGQSSSGGGDFVCFGLNEGYPEFRFDVGSGPAIIRGNIKLNMTQWHTVKLTRFIRKGTMVVNDEPAYTGVSPGMFKHLNLMENMYLGSVPDFNVVPRAAGFRTGFVGSVSEVKIKGISLNLGAEALEVIGIEQYDVCHYNPCLNGGICVPRNSKYGYECHCRQGFAGTRCETTGES